MSLKYGRLQLVYIYMYIRQRKRKENVLGLKDKLMQVFFKSINSALFL